MKSLVKFNKKVDFNAPISTERCTCSRLFNIGCIIEIKIGGSTEPPIFFYFLANTREISRFRNKHNGLVLPCFEG